MSNQHTNLNQIQTQINQITESLDGTTAQIEALNRKMEENSKTLMENLTAVNENMRLILQVIKKGRDNTKERLDSILDKIKVELERIWEEKALETITKDEMQAVEKLKDINKELSENLYMQRLLAIITSLRDILQKSVVVKREKEKTM